MRNYRILLAATAVLVLVGTIVYVVLQISTGSPSERPPRTGQFDPSGSQRIDSPVGAAQRAAYESPLGYSLWLPPDTSVEEKAPLAEGFSPSTRFKGVFGSLCISPGYGCGGKGLEGWSFEEIIIWTADGRSLNIGLSISDEGEGNLVALSLRKAVEPLPNSWTSSAQIVLSTSREHLETAEAILASLKFK